MRSCGRAYLTSCIREGVEYRVDDNVRVYGEDFSEPHIGRITGLWQDEGSPTTKVLLRWFLRHKEVKPHAHDNPRELFLAFGQGPGVLNENDLDVIVGKCKVVCTSKDLRNKESSATDIENSDYFFSHVYDVDLECTSPIEGVFDKLGLNAVNRIQEKATKPQGNQMSKDDVKELLSVGSPLSEVKKRPKDAEKVANSERKKLVKAKSSFDESSRKNKVKALDDKTSLSEENQEKSGGDSVSKLLTTMPGKGSNIDDLIIKKIQITDVENPVGGASLSPSKGERGEKTSSDYCAASVSIGLEKGSSIQENLPSPRTTVDSPELHAAEESSKNVTHVGQANARGKLDEKAQKKANAYPHDTQKLKDVDGLKLAGKIDPGLTGVDPSSRQFSKAKELVRPENTLNSKSSVTGRAQEVDFVKESKPNMAKKMKMATYTETEKRPSSTVELVRAIEKRKIFKQLTWEENLEQGLPNGKVLLLQNFDPLATSADVREMLKNTFQGLIDAQVLQQESICPSGQALAIFETKGLADSALAAMDTKCLVATDSKRPVIATRVKESTNQSRFPGHLALERLKLGRNLSSEEYKRAVSTSHSSQPNTIEFEMAMEWRQLQEITHNCRAELFKKQRKEINDLRNRGTSKVPSSK